LFCRVIGMAGVHLGMRGVPYLEVKMHMSGFVVIHGGVVACRVKLSGLLGMYVHMHTGMTGLVDFIHMGGRPRAADQQVIDNQDVDE
jgi:hypothetical protein